LDQKLQKDVQDSSKKNKLEELLAFIWNEVEGEVEGLSLAQNGFQDKLKVQNARTGNEHKKKAEIPTVASLHIGNTSGCAFCDGRHNSFRCFKRGYPSKYCKFLLFVQIQNDPKQPFFHG